MEVESRIIKAEDNDHGNFCATETATLISVAIKRKRI
jgi:hypothetical protein